MKGKQMMLMRTGTVPSDSDDEIDDGLMQMGDWLIINKQEVNLSGIDI